MLVEVALFTGDQKYLEPIPPALDWYKRSALPNGRYARFYELKTNRPLYMTSDNRTSYWLTYDDGDLPDHYGFQGRSYPSRAEKAYDEIKAKGLEQYAEGRQPKPLTETQRVAAAEKMEANVRKVLAAQDDRGRWVRSGKIYMQEFERNIQALAAYVKLASGR
jgi:hypothetical protein